MSARRRSALAIALLLAALASAGCGVGAGEDVGEVSLLVTRDYGAEPLAGPAAVEVSESDTVMRVLDREAEIETRYGNRFVSAIEGLSEGVRGGRRHDWFFYVNGLWSPYGAAEYDLRGGEAIWWDYRDWSASTRVSAVVGSWPQPFADGYEGEQRPTALECRGGGEACAVAGRRLGEAGATLVTAGAEGAIRVLVGPWARVRRDPTAADLEHGPGVSGVYAEFTPAAGPAEGEGPRRGGGPAPGEEPARGNGGFELRGVDAGGEPARAFGPRAGLVAATRRGDAPPVWVVTGPTQRGALAAARSLDGVALRDHYALAIDGEERVPLPVEPTQ